MSNYQDNLTPKLAKADSWQARFRALVKALRSLKYLLTLFVLALTLDVIFQFSTSARVVVIAAYFGFLTLLFVYICYQILFHRSGIEKIARDIESKDEALGSSLINSLQLADQLKSEKLSESSKALAAKALDDYAKRIDSNKFKEILNPGILGNEIKKSFLAVIIVIGICFCFSHIFKLHIIRYLDPYGDHPAYSLTTLTIVTPVENHKVLYNSSALVNIEVSGHKPGELFITFHEEKNPEKVTTLPMYKKGADGFTQKLSKLKTPIIIYAHTRNKRTVSHKRKIDIIYTPRVESAIVKISPPEYTGRKTRELPFRWNNITALTGSEITYTLQSNRPLKKGRIEQIHGTEKSVVNMTPSGPDTVSGSIIIKENMRLRFYVTDTDGNDSIELLKGSLTVTYDRPPTVTITNPEKNSFVTEDFILQVRAQADDDYGVKELRIHRGLNNFFGPPLVIEPEQKNLSSFDHILSIPIKDLGVVPGDILGFFADTLDNSPEQQTAVSPIVYLKVISVEEYNEFLRERAQISDIANKYEDLLQRHAELREEQEKINEEIAKLEEELKKGEKFDPKEMKAKLNKLIREQNEVNQKMDKLAKEFASFVRDNPLYDIEKSFDEELKEKAEELQEAAAQNKEALESFSAGIDGAGGESSENMLEALQALRASTDRVAKKLHKEEEELDEKIVKTLKDLDKMNQLVRDFNYFVSLYKIQEKLTNQLKPFDIIRDLSNRDKLTLKKFAATEKFVGDEIVSLIKKLRKHAEEAQDQFPKAAKSALSLADNLEKARIQQLCKDAVNNMLLPDGPESYNMAEWIRREMEKMFNDSVQYDSPGNSSASLQQEFDRYLELMLEMPPMDTFAQMSQSAGFGFGNGRGMGMGGMGDGKGGSGYSTQGPNIGLLGNEMLGGNDPRNPADNQGGKGNGRGKSPAAGDAISTTKEPSQTDQSKTRRNQGDTVSPEALIGEYENIIEAYFEKVTK